MAANAAIGCGSCLPSWAVWGTARWPGITPSQMPRHPILGPRLVDCSELVNRVEGRSINEIFGSPDDLKFHSCMTLFSLVQDTAPVFKVALAKYFGGALDQLTTEQLATKGADP